MSSKLSILIVIVFLIFVQADLIAFDDETANPPLNVPKTDQKISLDGQLTEDFWQKALMIDLPYEVQVGDNVAAPVKTQVYLITTDSHLYVAFKAFDPEPGKILGRFRDRDSMGGDDWVGVILDTFNDERRSLDFLVTAGGVQTDAIEAGDFDDSWDAIWDSEVKINDWGYSVEMAIPFTAIKFQRSEGEQIWGFDAVRRYPRDYQYHIGTFPRDRSNNCYLCQAIKIKGFEGADPGRNMEITPTLTMANTQERKNFPEGDFQEKENVSEMGVNAKWGITPNMTLNGTINPDFSQIEADSRQLDINEPFALFFQEKRPFFTEGADYFQTDMNAVYTRMIRNPIWGAKLTGKEGANTFGAYVIRDDVTNFIFPGARDSDSTSLNRENTAAVLRYKRDFGDDLTIGALGTLREGEDYHNRVASFDAKFRITDRDIVSGQAMYSSTQYPESVSSSFDQDKESFGGHALSLSYDHDTRDDFWYANYQDISSDFRSDLGFIPMVGYRQGSIGYGQNTIAEEKTWWSNLNYGVGYDYSQDSAGNLIESSIDTFFNFNGSMQSNVHVGGIISREEYQGKRFGRSYVNINGSFQPTSKMKLGLGAIVGDRTDYANVQQGSRVRLNPYLVYDVGQHLRFSLDHTYEKMNVDAGRLYTANITEFHTTYQFDNRSFLRAILQYVDYDYNVENYLKSRDPQFQHLFTQLLFSYKINPQTVLYLGYSDNYYGDQLYDITRNDYTIFAKVGYALVM